MKNISKLGQEFGQYMLQLTSELFLGSGQPRSLSEMERNIRTMSLKVGQYLLSSWLAKQETAYPAETSPCPHCGGPASYQFQRTGTLLTILGQVEYKRAYYAAERTWKGNSTLSSTQPGT